LLRALVRWPLGYAGPPDSVEAEKGILCPRAVRVRLSHSSASYGVHDDFYAAYLRCVPLSPSS